MDNRVLERAECRTKHAFNRGLFQCDATRRDLGCNQLQNGLAIDTIIWRKLENSDGSADQTALANCRRNGPSDCKILTHAFDHCMALAVGSNRGTYGFSFGADRKSAAAAAMGHCDHAGGGKCAVVAAPCPDDDPKWSAPLPLPSGVQGGPVDRRMVGTWQVSVNPGYWIWRVAANGTYKFHSEAMDGARTNAGTISVSNGNYSMHALNMRFDYTASYTFQGPDILIVKGSLGTSTYHRMTASGR